MRLRDADGHDDDDGVHADDGHDVHADGDRDDDGDVHSDSLPAGG